MLYRIIMYGNIWKISENPIVVGLAYFVALSYLIQENSSRRLGLFFFFAVCLSTVTKNMLVILAGSIAGTELLCRVIWKETFETIQTVSDKIVLLQQNKLLDIEKQALDAANQAQKKTIADVTAKALEFKSQRDNQNAKLTQRTNAIQSAKNILAA